MYLLAACMGAAVLIGVWQYMGREDGRQMDKNSIRIGVLLYRGDDTFIGTLRSGLEDKAKEYEQETGIKVKLDIMDAKGSQNTQNSQVERLISLGCDALCINSVGRSSSTAAQRCTTWERTPRNPPCSRETSWWMPIIRIHEPWTPTATDW